MNSLAFEKDVQAEKRSHSNRLAAASSSEERNAKSDISQSENALTKEAMTESADEEPRRYSFHDGSLKQAPVDPEVLSEYPEPDKTLFKAQKYDVPFEEPLLSKSSHLLKRKYDKSSVAALPTTENDLQKQCLYKGNVDVAVSVTLELIATSESGILHHVSSFLSPKDSTTLSSASATFCTAMRGCFLRLDWSSKSLSRWELYSNFDRKNNKSRMTSWNVVGAIIRADQTDAPVWSALNVKELRKLFLVCTWDSFDILPIQDCIKLECFDAGISCSSLPNLDKLKKCENLRYLYIRSCNDVVTVSEFLPETSLLVELSLYMCKELTRIDALKSCANLQILDLGGCTSLCDLEPLKNCKLLEKLSLADCFRVRTIAALEGHQNLYHLDLTGCSSIQSFDSLPTIPSLSRVPLKRCSCAAVFMLLHSSSLVLSTFATESLSSASLWSLEAVLTDTIELLQPSRSNSLLHSQLLLRQREQAAEVLAAAAAQDTGGRSVLLEHHALLPTLRAIGNGSPKLQEHAIAIIARLSHNRNSVEEIAAAGGVEKMVNIIVQGCEMLMSPAASFDSQCINMCMEHAASALLLIALVEGQRNRIVQASGVEALVRLLEVGSDGASVEAAGALWNLGATLNIGKRIVTSGAVPVLIKTLGNRPIAAKVQAAGALRNLAILNENKLRLCEFGLVEALVELISPGVLSPENEEQLGLLVKAVATLRILSSTPEIQMQVASKGAIPRLNWQLKSDRQTLRRQASGALLALSFNEANRSKMADAGIIPSLVRIVSFETSDSIVMSAAGCLWNLAMNDDLERMIVANNAIPALIRRLSSRNVEVVCKAAGALKNLSYQREHKEAVARHGGIEKLVELIKDPTSRVLPYAVGALRLVASGTPATRDLIVRAGAIEKLVQLLALTDKSRDSVRLASGTLLHLADSHTTAMLQAGAVPHLLAISKWADAPLLVREEARYILQRITLSPNDKPELLALEDSYCDFRRLKDDIVLKRVRGIPGDTNVSHNNFITFLSYSSVATETYLSRGKVYYEVEVVSIKGFPTFGWISQGFEIGINHLYDCGVGFPGDKHTSHDSWAIDGVNKRKWPAKVSYGKHWKVGDVVTVAADLESGTLTFGLNGDFSQPMGVAYHNIFAGRERFAISPALSGSHNTMVGVNFGERSFRFPPPSPDYISVLDARVETYSES